MKEKIPTNLTPEEQERKDQEAQYEQYMLDHPERIILPENLRESGPEIAEFEEMIALFESKYSLAELHSITNLTVEEAKQNPVREPARVALNPIVAKLNVLEEETNISPEKYEELKAKYKILSRAVGMINNNKVDHDR